MDDIASAVASDFGLDVEYVAQERDRVDPFDRSASDSFSIPVVGFGVAVRIVLGVSAVRVVTDLFDSHGILLLFCLGA